MKDITKAVYSVPEAAEVLGISRTLAYCLANEGELPVLKLGKRKVIPKIALEKMLGSITNECERKVSEIEQRWL